MGQPTSDPVGDDAFGQRLLAFEPRLVSFLQRLCRAPADDLVQETLARAWRSRRSFDAARGGLESWLLRIAFRTFLDERARANGAPGTLAEDLPAGTADPAEAAAIREQITALLRGLGDRERDVLLRFHRDGCSIAEIAHALALPSGTVKSHLHRARQKLWQQTATRDRAARGQDPT